MDEEGRDDWPELLEQARRGSDEALGVICERLQIYLQAAVNLRSNYALRSKVSDSDILQQTMLDVCQSIVSFRGATEPQCKAWIRRCLQRNLLDSVRKYRGTQRRQVAREQSIHGRASIDVSMADSQTASRILIQEEADAELLAAVERLPNIQRQVIELRHRGGLDYAEIGDRLGMTDVAARKCWSRAVATLARVLAPQ